MNSTIEKEANKITAIAEDKYSNSTVVITKEGISNSVNKKLDD